MPSRTVALTANQRDVDATFLLQKLPFLEVRIQPVMAKSPNSVTSDLRTTEAAISARFEFDEILARVRKFELGLGSLAYRPSNSDARVIALRRFDAERVPVRIEVSQRLP